MDSSKEFVQIFSARLEAATWEVPLVSLVIYRVIKGFGGKFTSVLDSTAILKLETEKLAAKAPFFET